VSIDFIIGLLILEGYSNLVVLIDHLSKRVVVDSLEDIKTKIVVK
jgi:hypothetical protein